MELMGLGGFPCVGRTPESGEATEGLIPTLLGAAAFPHVCDSWSSWALIWDLYKPARALGQLCREGPGFLLGLPGPCREHREVCRGVLLAWGCTGGAGGDTMEHGGPGP